MKPCARVRQHFVDALNSALRFVQGRERGELDAEEMLLYALMRPVEIGSRSTAILCFSARISS